MIQYFNKAPQPGTLKQIPILKQAIKIIRISYPHNSIQRINPTISKAQNLQQIDLSYNKITTMEPIFQLRKLRVLNLSHNCISYVGKGICKLKKLQKIDLTGNFLATVHSVGSIIQLFKITRGVLEFNLQCNPVMDLHRHQIQQKITLYFEQIQRLKEKIQSKKQLKELQISKSLSKSKNYNNYQHQSHNFHLQVLALKNHQILGTLNESRKNLEKMSNTLVQYQRKFQVIHSSQFKGWSQNLLNIFRKQNQSIKSFIQTEMKIIKQLTTQFINISDATPKIQISFIQASQIHQLIKDYHSSLLQGLSQSHDTSMSSYKIWVELYREIRALSEKIRLQACNIIQCQIRNQQIQALKLISPSKSQNFKVRQGELEGLLFSRNKQFNPDKQYQCKECFIKNQQIRQLKEMIQVFNKQNEQFKALNESLKKQNQQFTKQSKILNKNFQKRQQQIISDLKQNINSSVFQKIFLNQAKSIQDFIKFNKHSTLNKNINSTQKFANLFQTSTALVKNREVKYQGEIVSEFFSNEQHGKNQSTQLAPKRPYFNKNEDSATNDNKKSKKNTQNSTQKKKKSINQIGFKYNKSNSNSKSSIAKSNLISRKTTQRQISEASINKYENRKITEISQIEKNTQNENGIIISDFAITQTGKQKGKQINQKSLQLQSNRKALAQLVMKKTFQNKISLNQGTNIDNTKKQSIKSRQSCKIQQTIDKENYSYVPSQYHSIKLKNEQPYNDYMRYHLRNNIIQTLQRKGKRHSLSKDTFTSSTRKQKDVKFFNKQEEKDKRNSNQQKDNNFFQTCLTSQRQIKKQVGKISYRNQSNNKSYTTLLSGKLRT